MICKKRIINVTQLNHLRESTEEAIESINKMKGTRISINNQTVLLNGLSKRFRLIMSHVRGKVEIVGTLDNQFILKFHQAKHENDHEMIFMKPIDEDACWLDENLNPIK